MSDCLNVEMRELLPDLLHGRLDGELAARVREHVALCAECAAELELLERVQRVYASLPQVDTAAIVRALPAARARRAAQVRRTYSLGALKVAAGLALLLSGALVTRVVMNGEWRGADSAELVVQPLDTSPLALPPARDTATVPTRTAQPRVLALSLGELHDMDADELETLLGALDDIDAVPAVEPDTLLGSVRGIGSE